MSTFDKYITKLEKETGKTFKNSKFNIDGWVFDNIARFQLNENNEIVKLKITDTGLKEIPKTILEISTLKELSLEGNAITSLPEKIKDLADLRFLNLAYNNFENFPNEIVACNNLETLILTENNIKELPCEIKDFKSLRIKFKQK